MVEEVSGEEDLLDEGVLPVGFREEVGGCQVVFVGVDVVHVLQ